jgi:hypothetical protein
VDVCEEGSEYVISEVCVNVEVRVIVEVEATSELTVSVVVVGMSTVKACPVVVL